MSNGRVRASAAPPIADKPTSTIRLIALDLDGTVMAKNQPIQPRVIAAIAEATRRGVKVTLATGRMFRATVPFARQVGANAPVICYQGAWVRRHDTGEFWLKRGIPLGLVHEVVALARDLDLHLNVYVDDEIYIESVTPSWTQYIAQATGASPPRVVGDFLVHLDQEPTHLALVTEATKSRELTYQVRDHFGGRLYVTTGHPLFCELSNPAVSKANALQLLAHRYGIAREEVMAIGDNMNDAEMVEWAGLGVAMGNASPDLLASADVVVGTVQADGVAEAIERFVLDA